MTKLVVLVHGFGSNKRKTWGSTPTALTTHSSLHGNIDVEPWEYRATKAPRIFEFLRTGIRSRTQTLEQLGEHLWSNLRVWVSEKPYSSIQLLGHSMGGLVIASAVGYGLDRHEPRDKKLIAALRGIAFIATPLGGADLARIAKPLYWFAGENIHRRDLEENSTSRKKLVTRFIHLALGKHKLPLKIFRAANDFAINEEELTRPLEGGSYEADVLAGGHSQCIKDLEAGCENLSKLITWMTSNTPETQYDGTDNESILEERKGVEG